MRRPAPQDHSPDLAECLFHERARRQRARQTERCREPESLGPRTALATLSLLPGGQAVLSCDEDLDQQDLLDALTEAIEQIREALGQADDED
jgi:hypothetical protein